MVTLRYTGSHLRVRFLSPDQEKQNFTEIWGAIFISITFYPELFKAFDILSSHNRKPIYSLSYPRCLVNGCGCSAIEGNASTQRHSFCSLEMTGHIPSNRLASGSCGEGEKRGLDQSRKAGEHQWQQHECPFLCPA